MVMELKLWLKYNRFMMERYSQSFFCFYYFQYRTYDEFVKYEKLKWTCCAFAYILSYIGHLTLPEYLYNEVIG